MAPLVLEGDTLGEKHRHYNELVKEAIANKPSRLGKINYEECDIDNLLKIDVASNMRDVEYILDVLKCEDMLYVSRAIKQCKWLITDNQYAYIINPDYLHTQLFPQMTTKAINKLSLHIRLNLKNEKRVEEFYNYFHKEKNIETAFKWLQHCSLQFTENVVEKYASDMETTLLKRLCEKSISVLDVFVKNYRYWKKYLLEETVFLIYRDTTKYLDILETLETPSEYPTLKKKHSEFIMKSHKQRILDNFEKYIYSIHLETVAKQLKPNEIKDFLLKHAKNEKLRDWYKHDNLVHFIKYLPTEGRFEFTKELFIDKTYKDHSHSYDDEYGYKCLQHATFCSSNTSANVYRWYKFAPFDTAFVDLKKFIGAESSPDERIAIFAILLTCCKHNLQHVQTLLQYYHDKHINEPYKFKSQFINNVILRTHTHKYNEKTWNILNDLFLSMEVYNEHSDKNVQSCIKTIIVYKILHDEKVPEVIEKKFIYSTLKEYQKKLNDEEKNKIRNYLFSYIKNKINDIVPTDNETEFKKSLELLKNILELLVDWNKELADHPCIINKIKEHINIYKEKSFDANTELSSIYNMKRSWKRLFFDESLTLCPTEETCINILKHNPKLLSKFNTEIEEMRNNDAISLIHLLRKLRIYWTQTLAAEWSNAYYKRLDQLSGHKALVRGLCTLLPRQQLLDIIKRYEPNEIKINWSESDELLLGLRKHFARNMYLGRPQPSPETVLSYAKGDYLQFALSSLLSIYFNLGVAATRITISKLLISPVSIQKHGIRLAFVKLKTEELKQNFSAMWKSTKNCSIRAELFKYTFKLMCTQKDPSITESIWELLSIFIDNLTPDDNKSINVTLGKLKKVPKCVKGKYFMKSYLHLKSLPTKCNCEGILQNMIHDAYEMMDLVDPEFVEKKLLSEYIENKFFKKRNTQSEFAILRVMTSYLLCVKDENSQKRRETFLVPFIERTLSMWNAKEKKKYYIRLNFQDLLKEIIKLLEGCVFVKKMLFPVKLCTKIQDAIEETLPIEENYVMLRRWKIFTALVKSLENHKSMLDNIETQESDFYIRQSNIKYNDIYLNAIPEFGNICLQYLLEDVKSYSPSVYLLLYTKVLNEIFNDFYFNSSLILKVLNCMLEQTNNTECCLAVIKIVNAQCISSRENEQLEMWREIITKIKTNESPEVKIHFNHSILNEDSVQDTDFY